MTRQVPTKTVSATVRARWTGYPGSNIHHPSVWTVGLLEQIAADMRAAGYDEHAKLTAQISRDPSGLDAFIFEETERVATEVMVEP